VTRCKWRIWKNRSLHAFSI